MHKRIVHYITFITLFATEVSIILFVRDRIIRPYIGDMIVVMVIYFGFRSIFPDGMKLLIPCIFLFAVMVEFLQLIHIVDIIGLGGNEAARIIIGSSFCYVDILCYLAGCLLLLPYEYIIKKRLR